MIYSNYYILWEYWGLHKDKLIQPLTYSCDRRKNWSDLNSLRWEETIKTLNPTAANTFDTWEEGEELQRGLLNIFESMHSIVEIEMSDSFLSEPLEHLNMYLFSFTTSNEPISLIMRNKELCIITHFSISKHFKENVLCQWPYKVIKVDQHNLTLELAQPIW